MQGQGFNPQGSFGMPKHLQKQVINRAQARKPSAPEEADLLEETAKPADTITDAPITAKSEQTADIVPDKVEPKADPEKKEKELMAARERLKKNYEKHLEIVITEEDIKNYIFRGRMVKKDVTILTGVLKGTFRTHTPREIDEIDQQLAEVRNAGKNTVDGIANQEALRVLSYVWMEADGRSLGDTPEKRLETIKDMGSQVADRASDAWNGINFLLNYALNEKAFLKKS